MSTLFPFFINPMKNSAKTSSPTLQDTPSDLYRLYKQAETPVDQEAFVLVALTALRAVKSKKNRPHDLELASALIVGDALRKLRALSGTEAYKGFLEKHKITTTDASTFIRLSEDAGVIEGLDVSGCTLPGVIARLAELKQKESEDALPFAQQLMGNSVSPPQQPTGRIRERGTYERDDDDEVVEAFRAAQRYGYPI
ncbi:hypothetical protein I1E95_02075 [Synechococcus sp. CBW1107]|uniref:hypothetical protein n=1 Tax=Synechococcus sp. CBW1107 TaxID=2789857 RepID=UPI0018CF1862|nr:hypothetical protein [Synechococcus sp. CBW1107]QPN56989.1 hypothetical protein I1E95_02075 [Synechococcus sp. CBW1107]